MKRVSDLRWTAFALLMIATLAMAALYGPFPCTNGCNARHPADGLTAAFIRSTVNAYLNDWYPNFRWRPGDQLQICDGTWCATLDYSPLNGAFVWNAIRNPAVLDAGRRAWNEPVSYTPSQLDWMTRAALACLRGSFSWDSWGEYSYRNDGTVTVVAYGLNDVEDFCGF